MILDSAQQAKLKDYLLVTLESISEADNDALAEYILALLKNDKPHSQLQRECSEQLEEFLESHTKNFVLGLFIWLKKHGVNVGSNAHDSNDSPQELEDNLNLIQPKQDTQSYNREPKAKNLKNQNNYPNETHDTRQTNKASMYGGKQNLDQYKPGRCPDFETKGFCVEGKNCRFTHEDAIPMDQQEVLNSQARNNPGLIDALNRPQQDDYDPSDPYFGNHGSRPNMMISRRPRGGFSHRGRGADRDHFSKYNNTRSNRFTPKEHNSSSGTTLTLVSIPKDRLTENTIKEYFGKFDEIVKIVLDRNTAKADIEFKSAEGANKAYTSPDPIFDNRFVKLFWKQTENTNRGPFYTPSFINNTLPSKTFDYAEKSKKEALLRKKKADLLAKQLEEQKKMLALIESKSISEEDKKFLLKSMNQLSDSIKETLDSIAETKSSSAKKFKDSNQSTLTSETSVNLVSVPGSSNPSTLLRTQPRLGSNKWFPPRPEVTQTFRLDNRPTAFKITGFNTELQPTLEAHLKNVRGVDNVVFNAEDSCFVVECRNHYLAKRAQIDSSKLGENTFQSTWLDKTETTNLDQNSLPVAN